MIKEVKLPEVSDNIENGDVVKVLVSVGDTIEVDQPIIELETDKAMFEVPSTEKGVVKEISVKQGDVIDIGAVILKVETNGEDSKEDKSAEAKPKGEEKEAEEKTDEKKSSKDKSGGKEKGDEEDERKDGEDVKSKDTKSGEGKSEEKELLRKESKEKKTSGKQDAGKTSEVKKTEKEAAESEPAGDEEPEEKVAEDKKAKTREDDDKKSKTDSGENGKTDHAASKEYAPASPSVRRLARELGVDINMVNGSGSGSRITEDDIKKYVKSIIGGSESGVSTKQKALPDFEKWGDIDIQPMSKVRAITAETLTYAWTTIPAVTQFDKAEITQMEEFRKKYSKKSEEQNGHLTITSILVKLCTAALKTFPQFNSSIDFSKKEIIYKKYFNIGIAVDTDRGLLVPVIKDTDQKTITEISIELSELAEKARTKKITPDEMDGGNFTISNLGGIGGTNFTPIIYSPQVAILGVSRADKEAVFVNDKFEPRLILPLSLTYDHRIIDGADAARFLRWLCEALENPILSQL